MNEKPVQDHKRKLGRRLVIKLGKYFLRAMGRFQARHSLVNGGPVLNTADFPWIRGLEGAWVEIRQELDQVLENPDQIPTFHQISPDQARISKGNDWKTFGFLLFGHRIEENCRRCPHTAAVLDGLPGLQDAFFSILAPGYRVPPHRGPTRAILRCHLGLRVPRKREDCWIRIDDEICRWTEGECLVFDDTFEHEVHNDTEETRAVLFLDFDRPMDRIGTVFNRIIMRMIHASTYVQTPLKNMAAWNLARGNAPSS
jgi:aspartyl/asparaginyl beta-hydroxylase (cupin superfamily)